MTEQEAILRLRDHFAIHDDGRPTPFLNKAVSMAINALEKEFQYQEKFDMEIIFALSVVLMLSIKDIAMLAVREFIR